MRPWGMFRSSQPSFLSWPWRFCGAEASGRPAFPPASAWRRGVLEPRWRPGSFIMEPSPVWRPCGSGWNMTQRFCASRRYSMGTSWKRERPPQRMRMGSSQRWLPCLGRKPLWTLGICWCAAFWSAGTRRWRRPFCAPPYSRWWMEIPNLSRRGWKQNWPSRCSRRPAQTPGCCPLCRRRASSPLLSIQRFWSTVSQFPLKSRP